jgi:tetratricopeptide (TPR) repeat protein
MRLNAHIYLSIYLVFAITSNLVIPVNHNLTTSPNENSTTGGFSMLKNQIYVQGEYKPQYPGIDCRKETGKECGGQGKKSRKARYKKSVDLLKEGNTKQAKMELEDIIFDHPDDKNAYLLLKTINADAKLLIIREFGNESFKYKMKPSESLSQVAERFLGNKAWFYALARYNNINTSISINAGRTIRVPGKKTRPPGPDPGQVIIKKAQKEIKRGDFKSAISTLEKGLKKFKGHPEFIKLLVISYFENGENLYEKGQFNKAQKLVKKARKLDRGNTKVAALLKRIEARKAENLIQDILVLQAQKKLGDADYEGALGTLNKGMAQNPGNTQLSRLAVDIYIMHAERLLEDQELSKARENLLQAGKLDRGNTKVAALLKRIEARKAENKVQTREKESQAQTKVPESRGPTPAQKIYEKGLKHLNEGKKLEAFICFKQVRLKNPSHPEAQKNFKQLLKKLSDKYHRNAVSAYNLEDLESAFCNWDLILKIDPDHSRAKIRRDETKKMKCKLDNLNGKTCIPIDCSKIIPTTIICGSGL